MTVPAEQKRIIDVRERIGYFLNQAPADRVKYLFSCMSSCDEENIDAKLKVLSLLGLLYPDNLLHLRQLRNSKAGK